MTNSKIQFVGTPCGQHGSYTFYKAVKYVLHGKQKIISLGEFLFIKFIEAEDIISIGEPQLLWEDKSSGNILISLRLYFLPENTPDGRCDDHGEHEVLSMGEKIIMKMEDAINIFRTPDEIKWDTGLEGVYGAASEDPLCLESPVLYAPPITDYMDLRDVARERSLIGDNINPNSHHVIILSYNKYCRIRALLKRLEGVTNDLMKTSIVRALGGFLVPSHKTRLVYCRDIFEYTELDGHELLCNHLAPKLQGRPRKKRRPESESESSETSDDQRTWLKAKPSVVTKSNSLISAMNQKPSNYSISKTHHTALADQIDDFKNPALTKLMEAEFMEKLHQFMKDRNTAINRIPVLDNKLINIFELFTRVQQHGGYDTVCSRKLWKSLYEEFFNRHMSYLCGGGHNSYAGGNSMKKHYEKILLPYETFLVQEQRRLYNNKKANNTKAQQRNMNKQLKKVLDQFKSKEESSEPSVSILQPPTPSIGASFEVADGGSTTITLIPSTSEAPLTESTANSISISPIDESYGQITIPKVSMLKEPAMPTEATKRPEITITAIPRDSSGISSASLTSLQLADLVNMNANLNSSSRGRSINSLASDSALQDLAKYAERCDKPSSKKRKTEKPSRVNGTASGQRSVEDRWPSENPKPTLPIPELVSTEILRQMNMLESNSNFLLPAHQSSKTINALASLLPHTSIYPAQVPAAHQQHGRSSYKPSHVETVKPEPVFQTQSVYSQSKNIYLKPDSPVKETNHDRRSRNSSPEIEILDLRVPTDTRPNNNHQSRRNRLDIELLDLSNRKDITVSAVCRPGSSSSANINRSTDSSRHQRPVAVSPKLSPVSVQTNPLAGLSVPGLSPSALANLGMVSPSMLQYMMASAGAASDSHSPPGGSVPFLPYMDPAAMAAYYSSILPPGMMPHLGGNSPAMSSSAANNAAMAAAAQQQASLTSHLSQLASMGLIGLPGMSPDALANLGIYKNYLPQGTLPAPHFLSGLMSPGSGSGHPPPK